MLQFHLQNPNFITPISRTNRNFITIRPQNLKFHQIPTRKSIITCAKSKPIFTSHQSNKTLIQFARFAASNLHHILPSPYNSIIQHFSGAAGNGGAGGGINWKRFSGGGGGGRKRRFNKKAQFWVLGLGFVIVLGLGLGFRGELGVKNDVVVLGGMCLGMLLVLVRSGFVPEWLLGFFGGAVAAGGLFYKKDELRKLVKGVSRRRQRGRRGYKF